MRVVIQISFLCMLTACAGLIDLRPIADTTKKPERVKVPSRREAPKEPGSLWSETSEWNDLYSNSPTRVPGDVILIKLTPRFRTQMLRRLKRNYPIRVKLKVKEDEKDKKLKPELEAKVTAVPQEKLAEDDTLQIYGTIIEVFPRNVYRIKAQETIRVGSREPLLTLDGEIRNRDIQNDESVTADNLLNLAFELKPFGGDRDIAPDNGENG